MSRHPVEVSCKAFTKLQLHAAKYPHCAINGLLVACKQTLKESKAIEIVDAIPLFHQCIELTPMLEIALTHVDAHCHANDLFVAGYYEAPQHLPSSIEPSIFGSKIADKIHGNLESVLSGEKGKSLAHLVVIDNKRITKTDSVNFFEKANEGKWKRCSQKDITFQENCEPVLMHLLNRKVARDIVDFDNHLDDISAHWLNHAVNQLIAME
uniref:ER membrane protein complex subunit 8/9 homolog n=1 Tax=Ciona intestinalis TaxID=7719 RepID=UPI000180BE68|nr:ER membrane protein complex subunit 8/9 homolog [Ciona intestinalis]|eukprot:XP_002124407.1 ER membrane protein complex subunit 8/9 homolog [Ciona intestinalis]